MRAALDWTFSPAGDESIGVALTTSAVPLWMQLSLFDECRTRVERALAALPSEADRDTRQEMKLQAALGGSLVCTRSPTEPETGAAWTKALEIAEGLDDADYRLRSLWGLWYFHISNSRPRVAETFCALATNRPDPNDGLIGDRMIGVTQHTLADLPSGRCHLERVVAGYVASDSRHIICLQPDPLTTARVFLARILWLQGFPEAAMREAENSIADARAASDVVSLCHALALAAGPIALWTGDLASAENHIGMLLDHSTRHSLAYWHALGSSHQGVIVIRRGDVARGLRLLRGGFDELGEANTAFRLLTFLSEKAEALGRGGQIADGLLTIDEAIARSERTEERWPIAEFLRIKGELILLQAGPGAAPAAKNLFRQALDWASRQGTLSWELRAAMSLARLLRDRGSLVDAKALLQPVYHRFTEGFDTADLRTAKAFLDALP